MVVCLLGSLRCVVRRTPRNGRRSTAFTLSLLATHDTRERLRIHLFTLRRPKRFSRDTQSPNNFIIDSVRVCYNVSVLNKTRQGLFRVPRDWALILSTVNFLLIWVN